MSYADPFIPTSRVALLRALYADPRREWYQRELALEVGLPLTNLQRELIPLVRSGFIIGTQRGKKTFYRLNASCPIHNEVRLILLKSYGVVDEIRSSLEPYRKGMVWAFIRDDGSMLLDQEREIAVEIIGAVDRDELQFELWRLGSRLSRRIRIECKDPVGFEAQVRTKLPTALEIVSCKKIWLYGDAEAMNRLKRLPARRRDMIATGTRECTGRASK